VLDKLEMCPLVGIEPHGGFVDLENSFERVWKLLNKAGSVRLKTEKKKTYFVARASMDTPRSCSEPKRAIVFLRQYQKGGRLEKVAVCFECCWSHYYTCQPQRTGMYCKPLDRWASSSQVEEQ
jgi:hypothetical protein